MPPPVTVLDVPVLPAAGRPPARLLPKPVPLVRTVLRIWVTPLATSGSRTFLQSLLGSLSALWSLVVMVSTGEGTQYVPPEATVAYAEAKVSGDVLSEPRVTGDGKPWIFLPLPWCSPIWVIRSRTEQVPSLATSPAKAVLTENAAASVRLIGPLRLPSSLRTAHGSVPAHASRKSALVNIAGVVSLAGRAKMVELIGIPDVSASATANILAVEPNAKPMEPPYFSSTAQFTSVLPTDGLLENVVFCAMARTWPVPGSTMAAAAPIFAGLPIGTLAVSSCCAACCIFGLSVVWMVSPPRLIASLRSTSVLPSTGCSISHSLT